MTDIGVNVIMRETRDGCLIMELVKRAKSTTVAKTIALAINSKLGDSVRKVLQLGVQVEVEIFDLDAVSSTDEVQKALRAAIPGRDDPVVKAERDAICDVSMFGMQSHSRLSNRIKNI